MFTTHYSLLLLCSLCIENNGCLCRNGIWTLEGPTPTELTSTQRSPALTARVRHCLCSFSRAPAGKTAKPRTQKKKRGGVHRHRRTTTTTRSKNESAGVGSCSVPFFPIPRNNLNEVKRKGQN